MKAKTNDTIYLGLISLVSFLILIHLANAYRTIG